MGGLEFTLAFTLEQGYYKGRLSRPEPCTWLKGERFVIAVLPPRTEWGYRFFSFWQGHFLGFYKAQLLLGRFLPEPVSAALLLGASAGIELAEMSVFETSPVNLGDLAAGALGVTLASLKRRGYLSKLGFRWHWAYIRGGGEWEAMGLGFLDWSRVPDSYGPYAFGLEVPFERTSLELGVSYSAPSRSPARPGPFGDLSGRFFEPWSVGGERFPLYTKGPGVYLWLSAR